MSTEARQGRKRHWWIAATVLAALWAAIALLVAPRLIRSAWAGESFGFLNAVIRGRDLHSAEYYLSIWYDLAQTVTIGMVVLATVTALVYPFRKRLAARWEALVRAAPTVGWGGLLTLAVGFGLATGLIEALPWLVRARLSGDPREAPAFELLWMAPLAAALAGLIAAALLAALLHARRGVSLRLVVFVLATGLFHALIGAVAPGLHRIAILLLAIGLARVLSTRIGPESKRFLRLTRVAAAVLAGAALALGAGSLAWERLTERRALAAIEASESTTNVLFLILDTVRARSLSLYGYERATTPQLEHWLADGVVFDNAIAPTSWTLPSHASMFTGHLPNVLSTDFDSALDTAQPTLAEVLSSQGYATGGFVANLIFGTRQSGLDRGFMRYDDHPRDLSAFLASSRWLRTPVGWVRGLFGNHRTMVRKDAAAVNGQFLGWLDDIGDRPFFAFLNYFDAHHPYETHSPFDLKFRESPPRYWLMKGWSRGYNEDQLQEFTDAYDAAIAYVDHEIGVLLEELERQGILNNTLLVVVSDHGESLGEHEILIHANSLYLPQIRVPLGIRLPGRVPGGLRVSQPVSLADLPATALDIAGSGLPFEGESLTRYWDASVAGLMDESRLRGVYSELTYNRFAHPDDPIQRGPMRSIVSGDYHFILNGDGVAELYAYHSDPDETTNLATGPDAADTLQALREAIEFYVAGSGINLPTSSR